VRAVVRPQVDAVRHRGDAALVHLSGLLPARESRLRVRVLLPVPVTERELREKRVVDGANLFDGARLLPRRDERRPRGEVADVRADGVPARFRRARLRRRRRRDRSRRGGRVGGWLGDDAVRRGRGRRRRRRRCEGEDGWTGKSATIESARGRRGAGTAFGDATRGRDRGRGDSRGAIGRVERARSRGRRAASGSPTTWRPSAAGVAL
jgi:hypothetical protein